MQHPNCYSNVKNIDYSITIRGLFNGKIGSRLQVSLFFLFYQNFHPPPTNLILPNVPPSPHLLGSPHLFGTKEPKSIKMTIFYGTSLHPLSLDPHAITYSFIYPHIVTFPYP